MCVCVYVHRHVLKTPGQLSFKTSRSLCSGIIFSQWGQVTQFGRNTVWGTLLFVLGIISCHCDAQFVHWVKAVPPDLCVTKVFSQCWWLVSDLGVIFEYSLLILPESVFMLAVTERSFSILWLFFDWHSPPDHLDGFFRFKFPVFSSGKPALTGSLTPIRSGRSYTPALCLWGTFHNYNSVIV